jgi:hypothetical protein
MNELLPGVNVVAETVEKSGIQGTSMRVIVHGMEEESVEFVHSHTHGIHMHEGHTHEEHMHEEHTHEEHHHHSLMDIHREIETMDLPESVKKLACDVYDRIAAAEGRAHGREMTEIHFHEVGTKDAIIDIVGVCWLMDRLHPEQVLASPVRTGYGHVHCAHGVLPVPAPATAFLLQGIPCYAGDIEGELCTPTGAALLSAFVEEFVPMPIMTMGAVGYGMGKKEFPLLNCVRSYLGDCDSAVQTNGRIVELACNIDDMSAEEFAYAMEMLRGQGALEVYSVAAQMKKNRSGYVLTCLCRPEQETTVMEAMMKYTTTIGIRRRDWERYELQRTTEYIDSPYGKVRVKTSTGYGVEKKKAEYEDVARIAKEQECSIGAVRESLHLQE